MPLGSVPDEPDHWRYAYAVQTGQDMSDGSMTVPLSLAGFPAACVNEHPEASAACVPEIRSGPATTEATTHISSYPRLYYRVVGQPLTHWPEESGLIASRVLSALLCALLWGVAMLPWVGREAWLMRLAVLLTATPSALFFSGSINPQGMEVAAFAALWSLSVVVFSRLRAGGYGALPRWVQVSWPLVMVVAVNTRLLSAWYIAVLLLTCWLWFRPPLAGILRDRRLLAAAAVVLASVVGRGIAMVVQSSSSGLLGTGGSASADIPYPDLVVSAMWRVLNNPTDAIGLLGWLDTRVPSAATAVWFVMAGGILFFASPYLRRRHGVALGALFVCLAATWITLDPIMTRAQNIPFWQARYGFPLWMGAVVLLAAAVVTAPVSGRPSVVAPQRLGCALGLVVLQTLAVAYLMVRYMWPAGWFGPVGDAAWLPYAPSLVVAATAVAGALLLVAPTLLVAPRVEAAADVPDLERVAG